MSKQLEKKTPKRRRKCTKKGRDYKLTPEQSKVAANVLKAVIKRGFEILDRIEADRILDADVIE